MSVQPPYACTPEEQKVIREALNLTCENLRCSDPRCQQAARIAKLIESLLFERDRLRSQLAKQSTTGSSGAASAAPEREG